jgi:Poly A polymerase regulatory subunit
MLTMEPSEYFEDNLDEDILVEQDDFPMFLTSSILPMDYEKLKGLAPNKGQRKLFLSHLYFLLKVYSYWLATDQTKKVKIVYVGAAPGCSLSILDKLIDGASWISEWVIYDMVSFDDNLIESSRFECHQEYFTNDHAEALSGWEKEDHLLVFMDDIRLSPNPTDFPKKIKQGNRLVNNPAFNPEADRLIWNDINLGNNWLVSIQPWMWWRKFRMPYEPVGTHTSIECIPGIEDVFQAWIGAGSTEIRRWGTNAELSKLEVVDFKHYEGQLQRYNAELRDKRYQHNVRLRGLCFCHDCNFEIVVWSDFIILFKKQKVTTFSVINYIKWLDSKLPKGSVLFDAQSPHGKYPWMSMNDRWKKMEDDKKKYQVSKDRKNKNRAGGTSKQTPKKCRNCSRWFTPRQVHHHYCSACR